MYLRHKPCTSSSVVLYPSIFFFFFFFFFGYALYLFLCRVQRYIHPPSAYTQAHLPIPKTYFFWSQIVSLSLSLLARIIAIRIHTSDTTLHLAEPRHPVLPGGVHDSAPYHVAYVHPAHDRLGASYHAHRHPSRWAHCHPTGPGARP